MAKKIKKATEKMVIYDQTGNDIIANYQPEQLNSIKQTVAKDSTDEELYMFLQISSMYGLNPFLKEIWFTKNRDGDTMIMTSRDGYLKIAKQNPDFKKCQSMAVYENDEFEMEMNMGEVLNIHHKIQQNDRGKLVGAYAILNTYSNDKLVCYCDFKEYNRSNRVWHNYPSAMIRKCAENDVLKRFANIRGLQSYEDAPKSEQNLSEDIIDITID